MKKAILTVGLFSLMMILTSFTSPEIGGAQTAPRDPNAKEAEIGGAQTAPRGFAEIGGAQTAPRGYSEIGVPRLHQEIQMQKKSVVLKLRQGDNT